MNSPERQGLRSWPWITAATVLFLYVASAAPVEAWCMKHGYGVESLVRPMVGSRPAPCIRILRPPSWFEKGYAPVEWMSRRPPLQWPLAAYRNWCFRVI